MSYLSRSGERGQEAAQPLFRDSDEDYEKRTQQDADTDVERQRLQASIRRLRAWLIAVSVVLGVACLYTLYNFRGAFKDHRALKQLTFAPPSRYSRSAFGETPLDKTCSAQRDRSVREISRVRLPIDTESR